MPLPDLEPLPTLASAYQPTPEVVALLAASRDGARAPRDGRLGVSHTYVVHHRIGVAGAWLMLGGYVSVGFGFAGAVACVTGGGSCAASVGLLYGGIAVIGGGGAMLFYGAIASSKDLDVNRTWGWLGVGLIAGSVVATGVVLSAEQPADVPAALALGGVGCAVVQLVVAGRAAHHSDFVLVPARGGLLVAGRF